MCRYQYTLILYPNGFFNFNLFNVVLYKNGVPIVRRLTKAIAKE